MKKFTYFTSEFVSPGHPDKVSDQISDAVLDACLKDDPNSRVACEVFCTTGLVVVGGEITTSTYIDVQDIVRKKIDEIGYRPGMGFDSNCGTLSCIHAQSPDIAMGVDIGGAGDQGIMFGGAVRETEELMPLALVLSREILVKLTNMMKNNEIKWARPDQKSQVTLAYDENGKVDHVDSIVVSVQHDEDVSHDEIEKTVIEKVVKPVLEKYNLSSENIKYYINPTGRFVIGGPHGDTGLTGRKIIVDTYGGYFRHGGGAFSGKDPSKVDRSAAYAARWVAKNIVAAELADKCEIQLSYAIGVPKPVSIKVDTFGTSKVDEEKISEAVSKVFDLSPRGIEKALELREGKFKYQDLAAFGHIGRTDIDTPWERLNKVDELKKSIN
ncbi:methionine adenosyltransferase [Fusobacterium polymorphum]|jgi:methionine adenosyltransferase|uniref:S-adenosylmethionine synthase n=1 Tax=Fusobacterium nucleatum subsp. polymorphum TaxID=76857 RepID=A0A241PYB8_FUSNP|nr:MULTISPECIES: methionine adenosyltransferase [Fusobacterium]ASG27490.1 methionine adenosyltransferase [Fusobacterium polymorphum]EUB30156.1 methionine adenosyltransferase [Fusobacterium sp. OBRC1]MBW9311060.1 methionine adenosyltransferase [Fusobacterium nucleatum]PHI17757.1 methionine adenosyltransferase [Fusobacterium polymorphum]QYR58967.1 methionine adenosyltransferase [Fusobacterium polymorphum]